MSHESAPSAAIDTERPYLMPRKSGAIDVAHIVTDDNGEIVYNDEGWVKLRSQVDGGTKDADPLVLRDGPQAYFADELAHDRPGLSPEQLERPLVFETELADTALESVGIENPAESAFSASTPQEADVTARPSLSRVDQILEELAAERASKAEEPTSEEQTDDAEAVTTESEEKSALESLLSDPSLEHVKSESNQLQSRLRNAVEKLDDLELLLAAVAREGGNVTEYASKIQNKLQMLKIDIGPGVIDTSFEDRTRNLYLTAEEILGDVRANKASTEEDQQKARRADEPIAEMANVGSIVAREFRDMREMLQASSPFMRNMNELMSSSRGYEHTISSLRKMIAATSEDLNSTRGRFLRLDANLEDIARIKAA